MIELFVLFCVLFGVFNLFCVFASNEKSAKENHVSVKGVLGYEVDQDVAYQYTQSIGIFSTFGSSFNREPEWCECSVRQFEDDFGVVHHQPNV